MRLQQQEIKHKSREQIATLMHYPLLGFSMPSSVNPVEYLTKLSSATTSAKSSPDAVATHRKPESAGSLNIDDKTRIRREIENQDEAPGDYASFNAVEKKKGGKSKKSKTHKSKKNHAATKEEPEGKSNYEGGNSADDESDEESGATKALHDIEHAVAAPFGGNKEDFALKNPSRNTSYETNELESLEEDPYEESNRFDSLAAQSLSEEDDDDDDDSGRKGSGGSKKKHEISNATKKSKPDEEEDDDDANEERSGHKKGNGHKKGKPA